jgi:hypothetical protein
MASPNFQAALATMGFNAATCGYFTLNGVNSSAELIWMLPKELTTWVASSTRTGAPIRGAAIEDGILFPFISLKSLCAHRAWSLCRSVCGLPLTEDAFTDPLRLQWVDQGNMLAGETEFDADTLEKLVSFDDWPTWEELLLFALRQMRNIRTGFSLEYLTWAISKVPAAARAATYNCIDDQTFALALHSGPSYVADTKRLFALIKPLLLGSPAYVFVSKYSVKGGDGRNAFICLKRQAEGTAAIASRKANAHTRIQFNSTQ